MNFLDKECCANCEWCYSIEDEEQVLIENSRYKEDSHNRPHAGDCALGERYDKDFWCPSFKGNLEFTTMREDTITSLKEEVKIIIGKLEIHKQDSKEYMNLLKRLRILLDKIKENSNKEEDDFVHEFYPLIYEKFGIKHPLPYFKAIEHAIDDDKYGTRIVCFRTLKDVEGMYIFGNNEELDRLFPSEVNHVSKKDRNKPESLLYKTSKEFEKSSHTFLYRVYEKNIKLPSGFHTPELIGEFGKIQMKTGVIEDEQEQILSAMKVVDDYINENGFDALTQFKGKIKMKR